MTQSRLFRKKVDKDYIILSDIGFHLELKNCEFDLEQYLKAYQVKQDEETGTREFVVSGVNVAIIGGTLKDNEYRVKIYIDKNGLRDTDADLAFRRIVGKAFPYTKDVANAIDAFNQYLIDHNIPSQYLPRRAVVPQNSRTGNAY